MTCYLQPVACAAPPPRSTFAIRPVIVTCLIRCVPDGNADQRRRRRQPVTLAVEQALDEPRREVRVQRAVRALQRCVDRVGHEYACRSTFPAARRRTSSWPGTPPRSQTASAAGPTGPCGRALISQTPSILARMNSYWTFWPGRVLYWPDWLSVASRCPVNSHRLELLAGRRRRDLRPVRNDGETGWAHRRRRPARCQDASSCAGRARGTARPQPDRTHNSRWRAGNQGRQPSDVHCFASAAGRRERLHVRLHLVAAAGSPARRTARRRGRAARRADRDHDRGQAPGAPSEARRR